MQVAHLIKIRLLDALVLRKAEATIRSYSPEQHATIRRLCTAATARLVLADDTTDSRFAAATIPLYCDAIRCLVSALVLSKQGPISTTTLELPEGIQKLEVLVDSSALLVVPRCYAEAISIFKSPDLLGIDQLSEDSAAERRAVIEEFAHWLRAQVESRTLPQIWTARISRTAAVVATVVGLLAWGIAAILAPKNLALNRPVKMSSQYPGTPNPSGATDGKVVGPFQAHTSIESDPWIAVDLGVVQHVSRVMIYNRTDGLYQEALPLALEFSEDGIEYRVVDRRTERFTGSDPWVFRSRNESTRFVRVHGRPDGYVVVTEIEIFGR